MTARGFDVFDQMAAAAVVAGTTPRTAPAPAPAPQATAAARRTAPDKMLRGAVYLLTFAGVVLLLAALAALTPLGRIDADITGPFVAAVVVALVAVVVGAVRA